MKRGNPKQVHDDAVIRNWSTRTAFAQWDACVDGGGCDGYRPIHYGRERGERALVNLNWREVQNYLSWLSGKTGKDYRLPSEAEWEYAARAGSTTRFSWGDDVGSERANCYGCNPSVRGPLPVGSFPANVFGLHDMHGNVYEWVEDCWNKSYDGAPSDGSAWLAGNCSFRVYRGGAWDVPPEQMRSAHRSAWERERRYTDLGFRVALTLAE